MTSERRNDGVGGSVSAEIDYEGDEFWWGQPFNPTFWRCTKCGLIFWRGVWYFFRCPSCQSVDIEEWGTFFLKPRARRFLQSRARIL